MNQTLRLHITVPVAPSAVYQAITDSSSLQGNDLERDTGDRGTASRRG